MTTCKSVCYVSVVAISHVQMIQCDHSKGDHSYDHSYADVVKFGDKHQNKHVADHSYACTMEESGALHNKT